MVSIQPNLKSELEYANMSVLKLDKLAGIAMLLIASVVFLYYTVWTLMMVCVLYSLIIPFFEPS